MEISTTATATARSEAEIGFVRADSDHDLIRLKRWRASTFWVMLIGYIGYYLCRTNLSSALPLLSQTFNYSNAQLGLIGFYSELAYAIGKLITGSLGDQIGGKRVFLIGLAGAIFFNVIFTLSSGLTFFIAVWCACRFFLSMGWGGIIKTMGTWYEKEVHGTVMGVISINFQFGGVLAALLCGYLVSRGATWQNLFTVPAAIATLVLIWSYFCSKESPQDVVPGTTFGNSAGKSQALVEYAHEGKKLSTFAIMKGLLGHKIYRQSIGFNMLMTILRIFFLFWTPKILVDLGMSNTSAILKSAIFPLLGCIGTILLGWYTDKHAKNGDRARMIWMMLSGLVVCLGIVTALIPYGLQYSSVIVLLLGLCGFFLYGPYAMTTGALALDIAGPKGASTACGILDFMGYGAAAFATWGAGQLADAYQGSWTRVFVLTTALAALSTFWAFMMSKELQKTKPIPAKS